MSKASVSWRLCFCTATGVVFDYTFARMQAICNGAVSVVCYTLLPQALQLQRKLPHQEQPHQEQPNEVRLCKKQPHGLRLIELDSVALKQAV